MTMKRRFQKASKTLFTHTKIFFFSLLYLPPTKRDNDGERRKEMKKKREKYKEKLIWKLSES